MDLTYGSGLFPFRQSGRLTQIVRVAANYEWLHYVERLGLSRYVPRDEPGPPAPSPNTDAVRLREAFEELGPTFAKLGQLLSVQRDLMPVDVVTELQHLQERVPPFPGEEAERIVEAELGAPVQTLFRHFDPTPFAAASIAQVHHATTHEGDRLVVKAQRPGISKVIDDDVAVLFFVARTTLWQNKCRRCRSVTSPTRRSDRTARLGPEHG